MESDNRKTKVVVKSINTWAVIMPYISLLLYFLSIFDICLMWVCSAFSVAIQFCCCFLLLEKDSKDIMVSNFKNEVDIENKQKSQINIHSCILFLLNSLPILYIFIGSCEKGMLVFVLEFLIECLYIGIMVKISDDDDVEKEYRLFLRTGMTSYERKVAEKAKKEADVAERKTKAAAIEAQKIELFGHNYYTIEGSEIYDIIVSEEKELIKIGNRTMNFSDIIDFKVSDDATEIYTPSQYKTETSTGSLIGRAIVGGILAGEIGAIIGATTASKEVIPVASYSKNRIHNFKIYITLNNINDPCYYIHLGSNSTLVNKLSSVLTFIVYKNKQENLELEQHSLSNNSVADEILKLAELKKQGFLSEEEFLIQKQKLLK